MKNLTPLTPSPKFDKTNHHYVPQFWMRLFAGADGHLWRRLQDGGHIRQTSTEEIMAEDWLYTEFDRHWRPGDGVEDRLAAREKNGAQLLRSLAALPGDPTDEQWAQLNVWLALTACRHPLAMRRMHHRAKNLAWDLADASSHSAPDFIAHIRGKFGVALAEDVQGDLVLRGDEALLAEADEIQGYSEQDPRLPMLIALAGVPEVALRYAIMDKVLLDAPAGKRFVLGDTPIALSNGSAGFAVPLTSRLALGSWPNDGSGLVLQDRKTADAATVDLINRDQASRAMKVVVGPDRATLQGL